MKSLTISILLFMSTIVYAGIELPALTERQPRIVIRLPLKTEFPDTPIQAFVQRQRTDKKLRIAGGTFIGMTAIGCFLNAKYPETQRIKAGEQIGSATFTLLGLLCSLLSYYLFTEPIPTYSLDSPVLITKE